jgi:UDP-N-acetylmuramoylalanine--D-glutamate ligase
MNSKVNFTQDKFVVIGAGDTGVSIVKFLQYKKASILRVLDTRETPPQIYPNIIGGKLDYANIADADVIVLSPGISIYEPVIQQAIVSGKQVVGDVELFAQNIEHWNAKVIGITGSNGKTTVTSLTGHLAESAGYKTLVAGNIGLAVLNAWLEIEQTKNYPEIIVLELSSFQLETIKTLHYHSATVLNISEDHLDRYRDLLEYAYAKANIFNNCDYQILNKDDVLVNAMRRPALPVSYFSICDADFSLLTENNKVFLTHKQKLILDCNELQLVGKHNYINALASLALLSAVGVTVDKLVTGLKTFVGLEHRMQKVTEHNGVLFVEDSKGTNVGAVIAGVSGMDRPVHLILGGDGKGQDFSPLRELVMNKCKSVAIIGADKYKINDVLIGIDLPIKLFDTLQDAVKFSISNAKSGDAVILSPACASWDMFDNYKHRAQVFIESVYENIK